MKRDTLVFVRGLTLVSRWMTAMSYGALLVKPFFLTLHIVIMLERGGKCSECTEIPIPQYQPCGRAVLDISDIYSFGSKSSTIAMMLGAKRC